MNKEDIKIFFKGFIKVFKPAFIIIILIILVVFSWNLMLHIFIRFGALGILLSTTIIFLIWGGIGCGISEV